MELEKLFLRKEELPILNETYFQVPIHPRLFDRNIQIDKKLANNVFPQAAEGWYNDLTEYTKTVEDKSTKEWINRVFLNKKPEIKKEYGGQMIEHLNWEDKVLTLENGLAHSLSISRNYGGTLYYNGEESGGILGGHVSFDEKINSEGNIRFSKDKAKEFAVKIYDDFFKVETYGLHNVDNYPGALFLRNWAILYMNEIFKQVFKK